MDIESIENLSEEDILNLYSNESLNEFLTGLVGNFSINCCHWRWYCNNYSGRCDPKTSLCSTVYCSYSFNGYSQTDCWVYAGVHEINTFVTSSSSSSDRSWLHQCR